MSILSSSNKKPKTLTEDTANHDAIYKDFLLYKQNKKKNQGKYLRYDG